MSDQPHKKCICDSCCRISPMMKRIREALPDDLKGDFEYLCNKLGCAEMDYEANEAKLNGQWPGWEWIIEAKAKAGFK